MNCPLCKNRYGAEKPAGNLRLATPADGIFDIGSICEVCAAKILDFMAALGWLPQSRAWAASPRED